MTLEKINEVPRINLALQKSPNITVKSASDKHSKQCFHQKVLLDVSHENKNVYFRNKKKTSQERTGQTVALEILPQAEISSTSLLTT